MRYSKMFARPISGWLSAALFFVLLVVVLPATAMQAQTPDFTGTLSSTGLPAAVIVKWSKGPMDRTWVSKDEVLTGPWTLVTASAAWSARSGHSSVVMPDGSIVLMGGFYWSNADDSNNMNDVWRSTDEGKHWTQIVAPAAWSARSGHSSVVMPNGYIVLMGGFDSGYRNDVWVSVDGGVSWAPLPNPPWPARNYHTSVVMPNGYILLMGGSDVAGPKNDVWRSVDGGATWTPLPDAPWSARMGHTSVALPNGHIVLMGGIDGDGASKNDVWRSVDGGSTWAQVPASVTWWTPRRLHTSVVLPDGRILLMGGGGGWGYENDVWVSSDEGQHWSQVTAGAAWSARMGHTSLVLPDGSIVLMGGLCAIDYKNDVWRLGMDGVDWLFTFLPLVIR